MFHLNMWDLNYYTLQRHEIKYEINTEPKKNVLAPKFWQDLYLDAKTADVYFVCGDAKERIPAHKMILSKAGRVFDDMFYGNSTENFNADVELPTTSPSAFKDFLQLIYLDKVDVKDENITAIIHLSDKYDLSIPELFYQLNIVPAEDSPINIVNTVHDDCIKIILQNLTNLQDYLSAALVCNRFRNIAIRNYPAKFKTVYINAGAYTEKSIEIKSAYKEMLIINFGSLLNSITWKERNGDDGKEFLDLITAYCGKTLKELKIVGLTLDFSTQLPFAVLHKLWLYESRIFNFPQTLLNQLDSLYLYGQNKFYIKQRFPNLEKCVFIKNAITEEELKEFLRKNGHLKDLKVINCKINALVFDYVGVYVENMRYLTLDLNNFAYAYELRKFMKRTELESIHLNYKNYYNYELIESLVENDFPIDGITVNCKHIAWFEHFDYALHLPDWEELHSYVRELPQIFTIKLHGNQRRIYSPWEQE